MQRQFRCVYYFGCHSGQRVPLRQTNLFYHIFLIFSTYFTIFYILLTKIPVPHFCTSGTGIVHRFPHLFSYKFYTKIRTIAVNTIQINIPARVGIRAARAVHFRLPVSFFTVSRVVEQGQCIRKKISTLTAVAHVHPFATNRARISAREESSKMLPSAVYAIIIRGMTISFAGNPSINAINITPSNPIILANGSKKFEQ